MSYSYRIKLHERLKRSKVKSCFHLLLVVRVLPWISGCQNFTCYFFRYSLLYRWNFLLIFKDIGTAKYIGLN